MRHIICRYMKDACTGAAGKALGDGGLSCARGVQYSAFAEVKRQELRGRVGHDADAVGKVPARRSVLSILAVFSLLKCLVSEGETLLVTRENSPALHPP